MKLASEYVEEVKKLICEVSVEQLHAALDEQDSVIIDVREHEEFVTGHVRNAVNFPRGVLESKLPQHPSVSHHSDPRLSLEELAQKNLYLICRSGSRTALAAKSLQDMGFTRVYSVAGGMLSWKDKGLETVIPV